MDNAISLPATYRIGGLEYTYREFPEDSDNDGFEATDRHDSPIFSLSVGPSKTAYFVHQVALSKSPVFEGCCTSGLRESQVKHIELPEDDPIVIGHLIDYLYVGYILTCSLRGDELADLLASVYIAADKYELHDLKEKTVQYLAEDHCLPELSQDRFLEVSEHIYCNMPDSDDCFRELFTDIACDRFEDHNFFFHTRDYLLSNAAFVEDLFEAQHQARMLSEIRHDEEHENDRKQLDACTRENTVHRQFLQYTKDDHQTSHPECTECEMWPSEEEVASLTEFVVDER